MIRKQTEYQSGSGEKPAAAFIYALRRLWGNGYVGLSMMSYTFGKEKRTCLGDFQLSGLMGKLLY